MIYTGPVNFFDYRYGKLPYRSGFSARDNQHACASISGSRELSQRASIRVTEFKYLTGREHTKTSIVYEYPREEGDPYYPVPRPENAELYKNTRR